MARDRVELMKSLSISVLDSTDGDNLYLSRHGINIPYNMTNFMTLTDSTLVTDVLRRFRERQMDVIPDGGEDAPPLEEWKKSRHESNVEQMAQYMEDITPKQFRGNNIVLKKKIIRDKLIEKGLMRSDAE
jgi:hypothetical protein